MPTKDVVTKVWIDPGCIVCDACETTSPDVFEVQHENDTCIIRPAALDAEFTKPRTGEIIEAAEECPVDVIKYETVQVEMTEEEAAAADKAAAGGGAAAGAGASGGDAAAKKEPPKPKEVDPAIQALLAATTVRGGHVVMNRGTEGLPENLQGKATMSADAATLPPDARHTKVMDKARPDKKQKSDDMSRRDLMLIAGWGSLGFVTLAGGPLAFARFMAPNVLEVEDPKVRCGPLSQYVALAPGEVNEDFKPVKPSGFWIIRQEDRIAALSIICTHLGCIPSWLPNDRKFKCPCHGSGFKQNGTNFEGPAPRPLERFKIYLEGDEVIVDRSKKFLAMGPTDIAVWNDPEAYIPV